MIGIVCSGRDMLAEKALTEVSLSKLPSSGECVHSENRIESTCAMQVTHPFALR